MSPRAPVCTIFPYTTLFRSSPVFGKDACTHETYRSTCASDVLAGADGGGNRATKILVGKCICEYADTALLPNTGEDRKSTRLNSSHTVISYAVVCLKNKTRR